MPGIHFPLYLMLWEYGLHLTGGEGGGEFRWFIRLPTEFDVVLFRSNKTFVRDIVVKWELFFVLSVKNTINVVSL